MNPTLNANEELAVLAAIGALLLIAGGLLLRRGWWTRRRGDTPYCRACGYQLHGNESGRCPECGRDTSPGNVVRGERVCRKGAAAGATLCLLAALCFASSVIRYTRNTDWYQYRPAAWVVADAGTANAATAKRAWQELSRRRAARMLPVSAEGRVVELALKEQAASTAGPLRQELVDYLGDAYLAGRLSGPDAERFFSRIYDLRVQVRPVIRVGDKVPVARQFTGVGPSKGPWWHRRSETGTYFDGKEIEPDGFRVTGTGLQSHDEGRRFVNPTLAPGTHVMEWRERVEIFSSGRPNRASTNSCFQKEFRYQGVFEVVQNTPSAGVKLLDRPDLADSIGSSLKVRELGGNNLHQRQNFLPLRLQTGPFPENVAFSVYLKIGGKEYPAGSVVDRKNQPASYPFLLSVDLKNTAAVEADVIFRSNESLARDTVDIIEIWKGEIVLPGVKIDPLSK